MKPSTTQLLNQLKALADPVRIRMLALCGVAECSVSELTQVTGLSQPRVSQHLKQLIAAGLLERFRDGHFVFYRVPSNRGDAPARRRLLALLPDDEPVFRKDVEKLRTLRAVDNPAPFVETGDERLLHKALVELTVATPLGDLLDIGCGQGRILKLLASRAQRVVGVDIDSDARRLARAELLLAGSPNCSLRHGDMYALPFADEEFDTIILDGVLTEAERPTAAIREAARLLKAGGRLLFLSATGTRTARQIGSDFADWAAQTGLRLAQPRSVPDKNPGWLLGVVTA
ncbi:MAG: metalloregulator ArsR/SmtB family transcription factor [Gammaproteobacteria bacterium]|nr:metalloregulator ArsR/SmtB family transcription factor [Gammaproteobacteria bacterium]MDH5617075.1 metalloregulator ArsR/SmtB family transcription factor [Gammaproteobacteria bacterium]